MHRLSFSIALALCCCSSGSAEVFPTGAQTPDGMAPLSAENLWRVKAAFNAGTRPRAIVFLSSECGACDTGSAALEETLERLAEHPTVLAIWEPIGPDDGRPSAAMLDNLTDSRVVQLWDPDHLMSSEMRRAERAHPGSPPQAPLRVDEDPDGTLYDAIALFAPESRWEATLPGPTYLEGGLEAKLPEVEVALRALSARRSRSR